MLPIGVGFNKGVQHTLADLKLKQQAFDADSFTCDRGHNGSQVRSKNDTMHFTLISSLYGPYSIYFEPHRVQEHHEIPCRDSI